jgi:hypothetical protein
MATKKLNRGDDFTRAIETLSKGSRLEVPRGLSFDVSRSPKLAADDVEIVATGSGADPIIRCTKANGIVISERRDVRVAGLRFECVGDPTGAGVKVYAGKDVTVEDCDVDGFTFNFLIEGVKRGDGSNVRIRRNRIANAWHPKAAHSSGIFTSWTEGLLIEHNIFDTNGWRPGKTKSTVFNHNCYLHASNGLAIVRGNIFHNASSHGLQQRCGGDCIGNVFLNNPMHMSYGHINGSPGFVGGVSGTIAGNVYVGGRDIAGEGRGCAIQLANIKAATLSDLLIAHGAGTWQAIMVSIPDDPDNPQQMVGVLELAIAPRVFVWAWPGGEYRIDGDYSVSASGIKKLGRISTPKNWRPPTSADLTKIINSASVRDRATPREQLATVLINRCQSAAGVSVTTPPPAPASPVVKLVLYRDMKVANPDLRDRDRVDDDCALEVKLVSGSIGGVRFSINGKELRTEKTAPYVLGVEEVAGRFGPHDWPQGPFTLTAELLDAAGKVLAKREHALIGEATGNPPPPDVPDVPAALSAAIAARDLLPGDPPAARAQVETVINCLN